MVYVAVVGGTGRLGSRIVKAILATNSHSVLVLSRGPALPELLKMGAKYVTVDYEDHKSLVEALQGVHTVISSVFSLDQEQLASSQLTLLNAAAEAGVKRFAPSEFAVVAIPNEPMVLYRAKLVVAAAVVKSGLEYTQFQNGIFMDYFICGAKGVGYLYPFKFVIDVENCTATIPGDGSAEVAFTSLDDIATFVAASLDLPQWPKQLNMVGEKLSYSQVLAIAEKVRGKKFEAIYLPEEELLKTPDEFHTQIFTEIMKGRLGDFDANLNRLFPEVETISVEELLKKWWSEV